MSENRIDPLNNPETVEGYCDECGENPVDVPVDDLDGRYLCRECADVE